jgi:hypothetical protein
LKILYVTYNADKGEAEVTFDKEFLNFDKVIQLDCLIDAIYELQNIYDKTLEGAYYNEGNTNEVGRDSE